MGNDQGFARISLSGVGLTDEDIYEAMRSVPGYIDITPGDFKELYCLAYRHATERFARSMRAKDIMVKRVFTVGPDTPLLEAAEVLSANGISGLPVVDANGTVLGVLSEKDILSRLGFEGKVSLMGILTRCLKEGRNLPIAARTLAAGDVMSSPAVTVPGDTPLIEIVRLLSERRINRLPVTDSEGRLSGIVARSDIVDATLRSGTCSWNTSPR